MRIILPNKKSYAKISLLLVVVVLTACNSLKRVDDNEMLISKNVIQVDSATINNELIESLIIQKPNSNLLGYNLRLNLYNLAKVNPDSSYQDWLNRKPKRKQRLINFLSEKQVHRLGESFLVKGYSEWLKNIGEAPSILDTAQTRRTLERLQAFYKTKGYFNNSTTYTIDSLSRKQRVGVNYKIKLGDPYMLDSVSHKIAAVAIDSIYGLIKNESYVKAGEQFDLENFDNERERLTAIFRNRGVYNFQESAIKYDIIRDTTTLGNDRKMDIQLNIDNLKKRTENSVTTSEYKVFKFDKLNIYTDYPDSDMVFERFGDYTIFYRNKLRFKSETLTDAVFFKKDSVYRDIDRTRTLRQISSLNVFRYPSITFEEDSTRTNLTANIYLSERPKYSFSTNLEVNHSSIQTVGLAFRPALQARNLFGGAENLSWSGRLNIGSSSDDNIRETDSRFFNLLEVGTELTLDFPRIWFPVLNTKKFIPNYMLPRTQISLGFSSQRNIGLDKQTFNTILGYNWSPSDFKKNTLELLNIQFVRNTNAERFFEVYQNTYENLDDIADNFENEASLSEFYEDADNNGTLELSTPKGTTGFTDAILNGNINTDQETIDAVRSINERRIRLTENNLIFASNYTFNKNNRRGPTDNNFYQFRFKVESAGNFLSALSYLFSFDERDGDLLVFDVPYSQYVKTEFDYVKYWDLSRANVLALRTFFGIAVPYGNSDNIPFVRSYFAGGSNDNRGWRPYSLGPGRTNAINDFNEANLKIALNLEYRFPIVGNFKGALFADAGNIWNVFDNVDDPEATFSGVESLKDIALGSGFGIRYDFTYFVLRGDVGFKTYNPAEETNKRWFRDYNFANSVLQIGINYPF